MSPRSLRAGALTGAGLALFYVVVVRGASGSWSHLADQVRGDWYFLAPILAGFATQVALIAELRHRRRLHRSVAAAGGAGAGASTVGMVACCAHHLADLAPIVGVTGAAAFLTDYRIAFMVVGIGVNALGAGIAARRLRNTPTARPRHEDVDACIAA